MITLCFKKRFTSTGLWQARCSIVDQSPSPTLSVCTNNYYETGPVFEKDDPNNQKSAEEIINPPFNKGVDSMPMYYTDWACKGRNFKIWEQSPYSHLEATNVTTDSQIYYYFSKLSHNFDLMMAKRAYFGDFWRRMELSELISMRESIANYLNKFGFYDSPNIGGLTGCPHCPQDEQIAQGFNEGEGGNGGGG